MATLKGPNNQLRPTADDSKSGSGTIKLLFDIHDAARALSMSVVSVRKLIRQGRLHRLPDFRKILISEAELHRFAASE